jgi:ubiquitin carboxyl-terminal hydrolase 12/46
MGKGHSKLEKHLEALPANERYFGFTNFGQTCYMNSVLQALYFCQPFRQAVLKQPLHKGDDTLLQALVDLFEQISTNKRKHGTLAPRKFFNKLRRDNEIFGKYVQQDAQEFMIYLLNRLSELLNELVPKKQSKRARQSSHGSDSSTASSKPEPTWVEDVFEGKLTTETRCLFCESVKKTDEPFLNLSVEVGQNASLTSCLKSFSAAEHMKGDSKYFCEACTSYQEAELRMRIKQLPKVLVVQLKRFKYIERLNALKKLSYRVAYPIELRLFNTTDDAVDGDRLYDLVAVVVHVGSRMNSGHYISIVKSANHWLVYDDDTVEVVPESFLERLFGMTETQQANSKQHSETAYILFYAASEGAAS